jgi:dGTPase
LNLGLNVYDGFLCHDGGIKSLQIVPRYGKAWEDHFADKEFKLKHPDSNIIPGTLEGCLVKLCDTMSYLGKDIEDAIILGILKREQVPKTSLGNTNGQILSALAADVIDNSYGKEYIGISQRVFDELKILRQFNFNNIYVHPKLKVESHKIKNSYRILLETLLQDLIAKKERSYIWENFLYDKGERYLRHTSESRMVVDYISGMTDRYFIRTLEKLIVPSRIEWS